MFRFHTTCAVGGFRGSLCGPSDEMGPGLGLVSTISRRLGIRLVQVLGKKSSNESNSRRYNLPRQVGS